MSGVLDSSLLSLWSESYTSQQSSFKLVSEETRRRSLSPYHLLFNSSAPRSPSPISQSTFSAFEEGQDRLSCETQVICWLDFDNEEISKDKPSDESKEICDEEVADSFHPLFINPVPWVPGQCFLGLFPDECLPQAVSTELLTLAMNIFRLSKSGYLRLGYDSLGANTDVNHLHFDVLFTEQFDGLPVEKARRKMIKESSLQHKNAEEINMFSMGVRLFEVEFPARCVVISPAGELGEGNMSDAIESVGNVTGMLVNHMIENNVPHSILIAGDKLEVFVFPRRFQQDLGVGKASFLDMAGVVCTHNQPPLNTAAGSLKDYLLMQKPGVKPLDTSPSY
jgi:hypothetical protein